MKKLYVGNLSYNTTEESLRAMFEQHGEVNSAKVIMDRDTGRSRGFGFVEMDDSGANAAIEKLNDQDLDGRNIRVNEARERESRPPRRDSGHW